MGNPKGTPTQVNLKVSGSSVVRSLEKDSKVANRPPRNDTFCRPPLHEDYPQHHRYKGDPGMTPRIYGAIGKRAQVILVWVRAPGFGNTSHPRRLGVTRVRP